MANSPIPPFNPLRSLRDKDVDPIGTEPDLPWPKTPKWLWLPNEVGMPLLVVQMGGLALGVNGHPLLGAGIMFGTWLLATPWWITAWLVARRKQARAASIARTPELEAWHARYDSAVREGLGLVEAVARADQGIETKAKPKLEAEGTLASRPTALSVADGSVFVERDTGRTVVARDGVWMVVSPDGLEPPNLSRLKSDTVRR